MINGFVNIWKPTGLTSHDVVSHVRRTAAQKRVGHTGTLDPLAEGVLPICLGKATAAAERITAKRKTYRCTMRLGVRTDSQDSTGTVTETRPVTCTQTDIEEVCRTFVGDKTQIPPMYSAVHHNGQRLYQLARQGITVARAPRNVTFFAIDLTEINAETVTFEVTCSKGAYIRTLCEDMGEALGCGAHMTALARTKCGIFTRENAVPLAEFEENPLPYIIPTEQLFADLPTVQANAEEERRVRNGALILNPYKADGEYAVFAQDGTFLCVSEGICENGTHLLKMAVGFY